ncbi:hypothetical protein CEXT_399241 [Caerostris extrusa]|uniref:Ycf1 n=1 Tax=Caerostris extrusa TaxID=172846 RepID=A0AAV4P098_CAEEX|nr:hypothetical protein CEXT_399241 [Caerostris extrusa]
MLLIKQIRSIDVSIRSINREDFHFDHESNHICSRSLFAERSSFFLKMDGLLKIKKRKNKEYESGKSKKKAHTQMESLFNESSSSSFNTPPEKGIHTIHNRKFLPHINDY